MITSSAVVIKANSMKIWLNSRVAKGTYPTWEAFGPWPYECVNLGFELRKDKAC